MARFVRRDSRTTGQMPGVPIYVGPPKQAAVTMSVFAYNEDWIDHSKAASVTECCAEREPGTVAWINIDGVHEVDLIQSIGSHFKLHPLAVEDIAHTGQRPKADDYDDQVFIVLRMLRWDDQAMQVIDEQVSIALGSTWVISFQETYGDVFDPVRERLQTSRGRIRKAGADYLAYVLIDAIVDHYFSILEILGDRIESLSEEMTENPRREDLAAIRHLKRELLFMRKSVWPLREVLGTLQRDASPLLQPATLPYLRDVYDHTIQIIDTVETFRDMVSGLMDVYLSTISNRMNEVMKVLTIIATIFIPLSFVAGLYGMNFVFMPELQWRYGYFAALGLMALIGGGMLLFFKRKKWL